MAEAKLRIKLKHDTEANWLKATTFKPLKGELIIYDVDSTHSAPRFKVGDGVNVVGDLPFADKDLAKLGDINADFLSDLLVAGAGISINKQANADKIEVKIDSSRSITATGFVASENGMSVSLYSDNIQYYDYYGNSYMYTFPSKNGTLTTDNSFKTINGNSIVGSGDITVATLAADNTFTGINIFHKEETATSGDKTISEAKIDPGPTAPLILLETKTVASDGLTITGDATIRPDSIVLSNTGGGYTTSITHDGFKVDQSGIYTDYHIGSIIHNTTGPSHAKQELTFPDKSGVLALTDDIDVKAAGNNTFTGMTNTFTNQVNLQGLVRIGSGNSITNLSSTSTTLINVNLPSKAGTLALTSDISVTEAGNNTFTGSNTYYGDYFALAAYYPTVQVDSGILKVGQVTSNNDANHTPTGTFASSTDYGHGSITYRPNTTTHITYTLPSRAGTLALTKDITTIEANPSASGTATLTKLKVGSTVYTLPSGGSGGTAGVSSIGGKTGAITLGAGLSMSNNQLVPKIKNIYLDSSDYLCIETN